MRAYWQTLTYKKDFNAGRTFKSTHANIPIELITEIITNTLNGKKKRLCIYIISAYFQNKRPL